MTFEIKSGVSYTEGRVAEPRLERGPLKADRIGVAVR